VILDYADQINDTEEKGRWSSTKTFYQSGEAALIQTSGLVRRYDESDYSQNGLYEQCKRSKP
jgi:hypothetical protein